MKLADTTQDRSRRRRSIPPTERSLLIVHGPSRGQTISLSAERPIVVGRASGDGAVMLADPRASRTHFEIAPTSSAHSLQIRDLGSRNGTRVNGKDITAAPLTHGDVVRAGDSLLVYCEDVYQRRREAFVQRAAQSSLHVLLLGESGVGKEVVARQIHDASGRKGPFLAFNCAAVPRDLLVSELFGHVRGAFSGAQQTREGLFSSARGGTLMLDEIGDMALDLQPALLRVLETRTVRPVGSDREYPVDVHVIAATNVRLTCLVETNGFRGDLYARLAQLTLEIPPLRKRREEVLDLARVLGCLGGRTFSPDADLAEALLLWDWPFNVRELQSLVRVLQTGSASGDVTTLSALLEVRPEIARGVPSSRNVTMPVQRSADILADAARLRSALEAVQGNVAALARELGTSRSHVYRWLRRWGLVPPRLRQHTGGHKFAPDQHK